jgi:hypothetical protein
VRAGALGGDADVLSQVAALLQRKLDRIRWSVELVAVAVRHSQPAIDVELLALGYVSAP